MLDRNVVFVGAAGEGIQSLGGLFSDALAACGYGVFSWQEFESRIRGGQSSFSLRVTERTKNAPALRADVLLALNDAALEAYAHRVAPGGLILCDGEETVGDRLRMPFSRLAAEVFGKKLYANSLAAGALAALLGMEQETLLEAIRKQYGDKERAIVETNLEAARWGYGLGRASGRAPEVGLPCAAQKTPARLLTGHEALAAGAAWAGCTYIAAYPMSPSTSIITFLAENQENLGVFVEQAEDEIAAVNMALGASFAGARAMTATSGGGFALMVEGVSLAGMTETPVVIVLAQRPGPATGLPTRTAQGDLLFAVHAGHGEFPKAVLAPADAADAFALAGRAFELADRFQIPVLILTDQFLSDARFRVEALDLDQPRQRPGLADPAALDVPYLRYRLTPDGVSPRLFPGQSAHLVAADSDEHDEAGHITEDLAGVVPRMVEKRRKKFQALREAMRPPRREGQESAPLVLAGWGSSLGALREAVELLEARGVAAGLVHFTELWPLPPVSAPPGQRWVAVEANDSGQFEQLLKLHAGIACAGAVRRIDGLPLEGAWIAERVLGLGLSEGGAR